MPQIELNFTSPKACECGFTPPVKNNDGQEIAFENMWQMVMLAGAPIALYICPKCAHIYVNQEFVENNKKVIQAQRSKIIQAPSVMPLRRVN